MGRMYTWYGNVYMAARESTSPTAAIMDLTTNQLPNVDRSYDLPVSNTAHSSTWRCRIITRVKQCWQINIYRVYKHNNKSLVHSHTLDIRSKLAGEVDGRVHSWRMRLCGDWLTNRRRIIGRRFGASPLVNFK